MTNPVPVLIVDDHAAFAEALAESLTQRGTATVHALDPSVVDDAAIITTATELGAQVVVLDLSLGRGRTGHVLIEPLRQCGARVVVLTASTDRRLLGRCAREGADVILDKSLPLRELERTIKDAIAGKQLMTPAERRDLLASAGGYVASAGDPFALLTDREAAVLRGLLAGRSTEDLAAEAYVSVNTLRTQLKSLFRKLNVNSRLAAAALARQAGWPPD